MKQLSTEQLERAFELIGMGIPKNYVMAVLADFVTERNELKDQDIKPYLQGFSKGFLASLKMIDYLLTKLEGKHES